MTKLYQCKICGESLTGQEKYCPNCHTPIGPSTVVEACPVHTVATQHEHKESIPSRITTLSSGSKTTARHVPEGMPCPRCGEMLMPGANVCEVCGEVISSIGRSDSGSDTSTLYSAVSPQSAGDSDEGLPAVISTVGRMPDTAALSRRVTKVSEPAASGRNGQVSVVMLAVICVLVALIAASITWAVISYSRSAAEDGQEEGYNDIQVDMSGTTSGTTGSGYIAAEPAVSSVPVPVAETKKIVDGDDVPIEGMRESLAGSWTFYGKVNNRFSIGIDMKIEPDGTVSGCYWYDSTLRQNGDEPSTYINIEGEVDDTGKVKLTAFKYGENRPSEHWTGRLSGVTPLKFDGSFRSISKGATYSFKTATR